MKRRLQLRVAVIVGAVGLALGVIASYVRFAADYRYELAMSGTTLRQLGETVRKTAAIAAYLNEEEIAREVVQGLSGNDIVASATLRSSTGMQVSSGDAGDPAALANAVVINLESPFVPGAATGELVIAPRADVIESRAQSLAWRSVPM